MKKASLLPDKIFPPGDTRVRINPTTNFPYNCMGQIVSYYGEDRVGRGTGMLLDPWHVLTCAHNIYDNVNQVLVKNITFTCARNANEYPYGPPIEAEQVFIPADYSMANPQNPNDPHFNPAEITEYLDDYGLIRLQQPIRNRVESYPQLYAASDLEFHHLGETLSIAGYPGDKPAGTLWEAAGSVITPDDPFLLHKVSTYNGQSGASVLGKFELENQPPWFAIVGIHVAGSELVGCNWAVRVTQDLIHQVLRWMEPDASR